MRIISGSVFGSFLIWFVVVCENETDEDREKNKNGKAKAFHFSPPILTQLNYKIFRKLYNSFFKKFAF